MRYRESLPDRALGAVIRCPRPVSAEWPDSYVIVKRTPTVGYAIYLCLGVFSCAYYVQRGKAESSSGPDDRPDAEGRLAKARPGSLFKFSRISPHYDALRFDLSVFEQVAREET